MDLDLSLQRNETKNLYQTTARYFGPLSFKVLLMCRLTRASKFGQADDTGDDISASALRIGERPICHARPCHLAGSGDVVFSKLSKLLNQEDALSGPR